MGQSSRTNPFRSALLIVCTGAFAFGAKRATAQTDPTAVALARPCAVAYDAQGDLFFSERSGNVVRELTAAGALVTVAGTREQGFSGDGGPAVSADLDSPCGVALDAAGNLYIADTRNDRVREVAAGTGTISTVVGNGSPGFGGDGGPAISAELSGPGGLAVNAAGDLYIADTRNDRVRKVRAGDGIIVTVAGTGVQGFSGDGGPALDANLDSPTGLALDEAGDLLIADTRNDRIREVMAADETIRTLAGTGPGGPGLPVFSGEGGMADGATLALPAAVTVDRAGNVYIADTENQRIRRIDAATGTMATVAGTGVQGFAGDGQAAAAASLDSPKAAAVSTAGLVTFADTANGRIRQVDTSATPEIHTVAGLGAELATGGLVLSAPSTVVYGTGVITAVLAGGATAGGTVTFLGAQSGSPAVLGTSTLSGGTAQLSTAALGVGTYTITASYGGDSTHGTAESQGVTMQVKPLAVAAAAQSVSLLYGQVVPALSGALTGVLARDGGNVSVVFATAASPFSGAASYPVTATLTGTAAANYTVSSTSGSVVIGKAPTTTSLSLTGAGGLSIQTVSSTAGVPSGSIAVLDGGSEIATLTLATGGAAYSSAALTSGSHSLTAVYSGDANFLPSNSAALAIGSSSGTTSGGNFTLAANGNTSVVVPSGTSAVYTLSMSPESGGLASPVDLTVSGLGTGMTASFDPAYLPPSSTATPFTLTVQTTKTARLVGPGDRGGAGEIAAAMLLAPWGWALKNGGRRSRACGTTFPRRGVIMASAACILFATLASGCGDRVNVGTAAQSAPTYTLTVTGTATSSSGTLIQHSVTVTLKVL